MEVRDQYGEHYAGAVVTFEIVSGGGTLTTRRDVTGHAGRAATILTLGPAVGPHTVIATVADVEPFTFSATARATPDFDGDGEIGFGDFFLFAEAFGGSEPRFDLDGSGHRRLRRLLPLRGALRSAGAGQARWPWPGR